MIEVVSDRSVEIIAFACSASVAITMATGIPIVRIIAREAPAPSKSIGRPKVVEPGPCVALGADWAILPFRGGDVGQGPAEIVVERGRLRLDLSPNVGAASFEATLLALLGDHRLHIAGEDGLVWKNGVYSMVVPNSLPFRARRLGAMAGHALFAIDPSRRTPLVARAALQAMRALTRNDTEDGR